jgi:protein-tyrosine phosphatase
MTTRVLFVCMGNICRSPTAEGVFRHVAEARGLAVEIESAGTIAYHEGEPPDRRSAAAARERGYDLSAIRARQVRDDDFERFDHILAMDQENLAGLLARCPSGAEAKVRLFLDCAIEDIETREVPDPYYGGPSGFDRVLDLVEAAARGLAAELS